MPTIPGQPLARFLGSPNDPRTAGESEVLASLQLADVILGRDITSRQEFVVFGRDVLQRVAQGEDEAAGYNVLCIEIDRSSGDTELELLIAFVRSAKGRSDYVDYGGTGS